MMRSRLVISGRIFPPVWLLAAFLLAGCGDDPIRPRSLEDLRGTVRHLDGSRAPGAWVYLAQDRDFFEYRTRVVSDSTQTDAGGRFAFDGLQGTGWRVYAGIWNRAGEDFFQVSPFSNNFTFPDKTSPPPPPDLLLRDVLHSGVVSGKVLYFDGLAEVPADSAHVTLYRYRGADLVVESDVWTMPSGDYALPAVETGNYAVGATLMFSADAPFPFFVAGESSVFFCDGKSLVRAPLLHLTDTMVDKPAVYIYPTEAGPHKVRLDLADRVRLTRSIPEYGEGWDVSIERNGRIDRQWDYLFYEIAMTGAPLLRQGWCLDGDDLRGGLERIVRRLGLNERETGDFLDYWLERLPRRPYFVIKPVLDDDLNCLARLRVDPAPDSVRRFWLFFSGSDRPLELTEPQIPPFVRRGGVLVEWGGAVVPLGPGF